MELRLPGGVVEQPEEQEAIIVVEDDTGLVVSVGILHFRLETDELLHANARVSKSNDQILTRSIYSGTQLLCIFLTPLSFLLSQSWDLSVGEKNLKSSYLRLRDTSLLFALITITTLFEPDITTFISAYPDSNTSAQAQYLNVLSPRCNWYDSTPGKVLICLQIASAYQWMIDHRTKL